MAISGAYFDVLLVGTGAVLAGDFLAVSGLDMEADYEVYTEGGSSYPRFFFKNVKPQHLVLEKGVYWFRGDKSIIINAMKDLQNV